MKASLFLFLFLLLLPRSEAQMLDIKFNLIKGKDGISLGKINGITQDPNGYMWFADQTQRCITRYDGYSMISFRNDPKNDNSLGGTDLECIISDPSGILWIGFNGKGLDRFDPKTGSFRHFRHKRNNPFSLSNDTVNVLLLDHLGNLWVGSYGGLDLLDYKTGQFKHYGYKAHDATSLSSDRIRSLYEDRQGTLWVGAGSAFEYDRPDEGGLNRFNRATGTFTRYLNDPENPNTLINNKVRAIFEDSRGTFWVGTSGDGLHTMDRATGVFKRYRYHADHPEQLSRPPIKDIDDHITFITEDRSGAVWIGTYEAGLSRYDPVTKKVIRFNANTPKASGFINNSGWTAYTSRDNVLWISTEPTNLYSMDPFHVIIPHIAATGSVHSFFQEADGTLWMGTDAGLLRNDRNGKNTERFVHDPLNPASISNDYIKSISKDSQGNLWIGTNGGLNKLDLSTLKFTHYRHNPRNNNSLISNEIIKTYVDHEGSLWISTEKGLDQLKPATGIFTHYQNDPKDTNSLSNNLVTDLFQDRHKRLWAATFFGGGINELDPVTHHFEHYLKGLDVNCVYQDSDGIIWAGTAVGLYRFDRRSGTFVTFTAPGNDLPYKHVTSIIEDDKKNLWLGTFEGIERLNPERSKVTVYGKYYGIERSLNFMAVYKGLNDELFFGAITGYYNFSPQQLITTSDKPPEILIADLSFGDKPANKGQNSSIYRSLIKTKEIVLNYNQNIFSFDFAAIDYCNPEENRHSSMLENYDNNWRQGNERTAFYFNVPPGHYIFHVKAANSKGIWAENAVTVIINPPWWRTWWAYTLYVLAVAGSLMAIVRFRLRSLRSELEKHKKERQLAELQKRKVELEMQVLRAQMNPHFIFNSLNSISRFILKNEKIQAAAYLTKFSRLVRFILQNSQTSLIALESELEALKLYLDLEALRFEHRFEYTINISDELDTEQIKVPPLLFQPFVENAIWHGLMQKEEKGKLQIDLFQEGPLLCCTIRDDGIGRQKAAALQSKSATRHKSMGLNITAHRIALLHKNGALDNAVQIRDLTLPDGSPAGTEILFKIPMHYD